MICICLPDSLESSQLEIYGIFRKHLCKMRTLASGQTFVCGALSNFVESHTISADFASLLLLAA